MKPDRKFDRIGLLQQRFTLFEHTKAMLDVAQRVVMSILLLISSQQPLVYSRAVVAGAGDQVALP